MLRSDKFNKIFNNYEGNDCTSVQEESNLYGHYTYTLINIESKVISLLKNDNIISSNRDNLPLIVTSKILTNILNKIQKHSDTKSYVLSKYYIKNDEKIINNCDNPIIAKIDTDTCNNIYNNVITSGMEWIKYLRVHGDNLDIYDFNDIKFINMKILTTIHGILLKKKLLAKRMKLP